MKDGIDINPSAKKPVQGDSGDFTPRKRARSKKVTNWDNLHLGGMYRNKMPKGKNAFILLSVIAVIIAVIAIVMNMPNGGESKNGQAIGISANPSFEGIAFPEGWDSQQSSTDVGSSASARNPSPAINRTCSFTQTTAYLDAKNLGRTSDFLSKEAIYAYAERNRANEGLAEDTSISVNGKMVPAIKLAFGSTLVTVKVFDGKVLEVPTDIAKSTPRGFETVTKEGIPMVALVYSCQDKSQFNMDTAVMLSSSVKVVTG